MTQFDTKFFQPFKFDKAQINQYFKNALRDLDIAKKDPFAEVKFTYSYQALIKAGIVLLAKTGGVRVRSVPGHHVKILEKMGEILHDEDILVIGDAMRTKRNLDFYGGGGSVNESEVKDYLYFVEKVLKKVEQTIA